MTSATSGPVSSPGWGPFDLGGRNVVVTGGNRGIGLAVAARMADAGANVLVSARRPEAADAALEHLAGRRGSAAATVCDVTEADAGERLVRDCSERFGRVDVLVNNAGIFPFAALLEMTPELFDEVMAVNLRAVVFVARACARHMVDEGIAGVLVNVSSIDAYRPSVLGYTAYGTSKAGVLQATRAMARELGPHGIRAVSISPGVILEEARSLSPETVETLANEVPLGRVGVPDEVATLAVFLASPAASFVNGTDIVVDGGALVL